MVEQVPPSPPQRVVARLSRLPSTHLLERLWSGLLELRRQRCCGTSVFRSNHTPAQQSAYQRCRCHRKCFALHCAAPFCWSALASTFFPLVSESAWSSTMLSL